MAFDYFEHYLTFSIFLFEQSSFKIAGASGQLLSLGEEYIAVMPGATLQVIGTGWFLLSEIMAFFLCNGFHDCRLLQI